MMSFERKTLCTNISFVTYPEQNFTSYVPTEYASTKAVELPNEAIRLLQNDVEQRIGLIFFSGTDHDMYLFSIMRGGDNFQSFLSEMHAVKTPLLIVTPPGLKKILEREFLKAGAIVAEYGRKGLRPSSICRVVSEGEKRKVVVIEDAISVN